MNTFKKNAFSLIELLIVVAIIGVLAALVVSSFSTVTEDARSVMVIQQQASLQEALNSWISMASSSTGYGSLQAAKSKYDDATTATAKLALLAPYLDATTLKQYSAHATVANALNTDTMKKNNQYVTFSAWTTGSYPKVELGP